MRVSVVIPTRDRVTMVQRAVASVVGQSLPVQEIIVVDDGSSDDTAEILCRLFPEVRLIPLAGRGSGMARNAGAASAGGDVLMFLDSDDCWFPDHVERLLRVMASGYDVAYGTTLTFDLVDGGSFLTPEDGVGVTGDCLDKLLGWCFLLPSSFAVRRLVFEKAGGFAGLAMAEDWELFCRLARRHHFGFCGPQPITARYLHAGSACGRTSREHIVAAMEAMHAAYVGGDLERKSNFQRLAAWTAASGREFSTVQQWYLALSENGMI